MASFFTSLEALAASIMSQGSDVGPPTLMEKSFQLLSVSNLVSQISFVSCLHVLDDAEKNQFENAFMPLP